MITDKKIAQTRAAVIARYNAHQKRVREVAATLPARYAALAVIKIALSQKDFYAFCCNGRGKFVQFEGTAYYLHADTGADSEAVLLYRADDGTWHDAL